MNNCKCVTCGNEVIRAKEWIEWANQGINFYKMKVKYCDDCFKIKANEALKNLPKTLEVLAYNETRKFIQIIDFDLPHYTGLVFEVDTELEKLWELNDRYWVKDILDDNGEKLAGGGWLRSVCLVLNNKHRLEYCLELIEQTKAVLLWQKANDY